MVLLGILSVLRKRQGGSKRARICKKRRVRQEGFTKKRGLVFVQKRPEKEVGEGGPNINCCELNDGERARERRHTKERKMLCLQHDG